MQPFKDHTGLAVPLDRIDVDTDQMVVRATAMAATFSTTGAISPMATRIPTLYSIFRATKGQPSYWLVQISAAALVENMLLGRSRTTDSASLLRRAMRTFFIQMRSTTALFL